MNSIKKQLCLVFVCSILIVNHIIAMDGSSPSSSSSGSGHRRSNSTSSGASNFASNVTIESLDSPVSSGKSPVGNLNDIDGNIPASTKQRPQSPPITITPEKGPQDIPAETFLNRENRFDNAKLNISIVPTVMLGGDRHNATWSESISSPVHWMPVITTVTLGVVQALLGEAAHWLKKDPILTALEKQILLAKYTNAEKSLEIEKSELEIKQSELEVKQNAIKSFQKNVAAIQANIDKLVEKINNGEELSAPEDKALEKSLAFMQRLAAAA